MKKLLAIVLLLLGIQACANNTENNAVKEHNKAQKETAMRETEIFGREPIYKLRVNLSNNTSDAAIIAKVNGVTVFQQFRSAYARNLVTVNDLIANGFNDISMMIMSKQNPLSPMIKATITLEVFAEGKHYILNHLSVDLSQKEITKDSTPPGRYSYTKEGFKADSNGTIVVGDISTEKFDSYRRGKADGLNITQRVSLPTPFPRWHFLDSPDIIDKTYDYLDKDEHDKLKHSPKIQALYALDAKLRAALKAKNPQSIIDLFSERFQESAAAFYDTPQNLKKLLLDDFIEYTHNPNCTLIEYSKEDHYFVIEENRKLAWVKRIQFYDKETGLYHKYTIRYRLNKQGEWVITR